MMIIKGQHVRGSVTYANAEILPDQLTPRNRPKWPAEGSIDWVPEDSWLFSLSSQHRSRALDSSIPTGDRWLDSNMRVNAMIQWNGPHTLLLRTEVINVFNKDYQEAIGFDTPGRQLRIGMGLT